MLQVNSDYGSTYTVQNTVKKMNALSSTVVHVKKTVELQSSINLSADSFSFEDVVSVVCPVVWQPRCNAYAYEAAVAADLGFTKIANGVEHQTV